MIVIPEDYDSSIKWGAVPILSHEGSLEEIRNKIPLFERRTFGPELKETIYRGLPTLFESPDVPPGVNPYYDTIVRCPLEDEEIPETPVGIVSPAYTLLQHREVFDEAFKALKTAEILTEHLTMRMELTPLGERMRLSLLLPQSYNLELPQEDDLILRLQCLNSVDGSTRFRVTIDWFRLICSNGLTTSDQRSAYRKRHNREMNLGDIAAVLREGLGSITDDRKTLIKWTQRSVNRETCQQWINAVVTKVWGVKAAARAWHIINEGHDVKFYDPFQKGTATEKTVIRQGSVPGATVPARNVFAIAQVLAWLAQDRRDVQEQQIWRQQIPGLVEPLLKQRRKAK